MYIIVNVSGGQLPIDLEHESRILSNGCQIDLEATCSEGWIKSNLVIPRFISLGLLHARTGDSVPAPEPVVIPTPLNLEPVVTQLSKAPEVVDEPKPAVSDEKSKPSPKLVEAVNPLPPKKEVTPEAKIKVEIIQPKPADPAKRKSKKP